MIRSILRSRRLVLTPGHEDGCDTPALDVRRRRTILRLGDDASPADFAAFVAAALPDDSRRVVLI